MGPKDNLDGNKAEEKAEMTPRTSVRGGGPIWNGPVAQCSLAGFEMKTAEDAGDAEEFER